MANRSDIPSAESMGGVGGADRAEADTPSGGSTGLQTLAIETALVPVNSELAALRRQLNDQGRQTSKDEIVFEGTAVRRVEGETERQLLQRLVKTYWGLDLKGFESNHVDEIKQVHWLPGKSEEKEPKRLLAKFLNLYNGSSFHKILHTKPKVPASGETCYRSLHKQTRNDIRMSFIVRQMRKAKEVSRFDFDSVSGRLKVRFPDGSKQTFSEASDLLARCSQQLVNEIARLDKEWKKCPNPGRKPGGKVKGSQSRK